MFRTICVAVVASFAVLLTSVGTASAAAPTPCAEEQHGHVFEQPIFVEHAGGDMDVTVVFLVCAPSGTVNIVDGKGGTYTDLDDFREHNTLFTAEDQLSLPKDFPSVQESRHIVLITVSGHTTSTRWVWWVVGGATLIVLAGVALWLRARHRARTDPLLDAYGLTASPSCPTTSAPPDPTRAPTPEPPDAAGPTRPSDPPSH